MDPGGPRSYSRSFLRGYVAELRRIKLFDEVRAGASPRLASLLDDPEMAPSWMDPEPLDEILVAVATLRGRDACRELGRQVMKSNAFLTVLEPIIHLAMSITGGGPSALFSRAQMMASVKARGIETLWKSTGPASGTMRIRSQGPMLDWSWAAWEGSLAYGLEFAGVKGSVSRARPAPDGRSCEIDVSWT